MLCEDSDFLKAYSCIFHINTACFAIEPIGDIIMNGAVEKHRFLAHYTDLNIEKYMVSYGDSKSQRKLLNFKNIIKVLLRVSGNETKVPFCVDARVIYQQAELH